ncbi:ribosomal-protein-alanine N-acetyltransferase [Bifidobacterium sp. SMB2]|uniref:Ribosomal-protein-alanine N-acetyltransferase n=1 Tax=Bifidobacterium saimiriisciurei TaxID=2661627 RepID=A0ABX0CAN3_9BIFI|nr:MULTISPECIES: ribosomal protein S18-alanine N-acetyltransferase [Bifidobacterium]NEG96052.1 ribosomal-protein-alanine N-acetyltransferase [Bifidobacterium sp. SMB2]NEH10870.1 ribosomal-protein-alanine N-acetyltransferase [Bifidobacterium saimiriisciurei]
MLYRLDELDRRTAIRALRDIELELFANHAWSENAIRQELDAPARTYLFDTADTEKNPAEGVRAEDIRGFAGFWYDGDDAEIMDVGVRRACQRQGIAWRLMGALIEDARHQGARRMLLEVRVDNDAAIGLYRRLGFERIGLRRRYYQPEGVDAYVMALDLRERVVGFQTATHDNDDRGTNTGHGGDGAHDNGERNL